MSKTLIFLLLTLQLTVSCQHSENAAALLEKHSSNQLTYNKLKTFLAQGIEKKKHFPPELIPKIIQTAEEYIGIPYCMGGMTEKCLDCSGFIVLIFKKHGILLPHSSEETARYGILVADWNNLIPGDLVFFIESYQTDNFITHSGLYIGDGKFIHASTKKGVIIASFEESSYWREKFIFGTRISEE